MSSGTKKFTRSGKKPSGDDGNAGNFVFNFTGNLGHAFNVGGIGTSPSIPTRSSVDLGTTSASLQTSGTSSTPSAPPPSNNVFVFGAGISGTTTSSTTIAIPKATLRRNVTDITPTTTTTESTNDLRRVKSYPIKPTSSPFTFGTSTNTSAPANTSTTSEAVGPKSSSAFGSTPAFTTSTSSNSTLSSTTTVPAVTSGTSTFSFGKSSSTTTLTSKPISTTSALSFGGGSTLANQPATTTAPASISTTGTLPFSFGKSTIPASSTAPATTSSTGTTPSLSSGAPTAVAPTTSTSTPTSTAGIPVFSFGTPAPSQKPKTSTPPTTSSIPMFSFKASTSSTTTSSTPTPSTSALGAGKTTSKNLATSTTTPPSTAIPSFSAKPTTTSAPVASSSPSAYSFSTILDNMKKAADQTPAQFNAVLITPSLDALRQKQVVTHINFRIDNILPTTRYTELPEQAKKELDELDRYIHGESQRCNHIVKDVAPKYKEATEMAKQKQKVLSCKLGSLSSAIQMQVNAVEELFDSLKHQIWHFSDGQRVIEACKQQGDRSSRRLDHYDDGDDYFVNLSTQLTTRLEEYKNCIREIEFMTDSWTKNKAQSPQDIARVMASQNETFLSLADKVAALHEHLQMEQELYTQYRLHSITL